MADDNTVLNLVRRDRRFARSAALLVMAIGGLVLVGWILDLAVLKSILPDFSTMKFNTALAFFLSGAALFTLRTYPRFSAGLAIIVILLALLILSQYLFGWNSGIDEWLIKDSATAANMYPGRISPIAALNFGLIGVALLVIYFKLYRLSQVVCLTAVFLALLAFIGYLYGVQSLYRIKAYSSIAFHTALTFIVIGQGILAATSDQGFVRITTAASPGGTLVRRLVPAVIIVPIFMGWLWWQGQRLGFYDTQFALALFTLSNIMIFFGLVVRLGWMLHDVNEEREKVVEALRQSRDELEDKVRERTASLEAATRSLGIELFERARVEQEIREQEHLLRLLIDNLPQNIFVKDLDSRFMMVNKAAVVDFDHVSEQEIAGKTDFDFHEADEAAVLRADEVEIFTSGQPRLNYEEAVYNRRFGGKRLFSTSKIPLRNEQGGVIGLLCVSQDITERREAEKALAEQRNLLRLLIDNLPQNIFVKDLDSRFVMANETAIVNFGFASELEVLGKSDFDFHEAAKAAVLRGDEVEIFTTGQAKINYEEAVYNRRFDGMRLFSTSKIPLRNGQGSVIGLLGVSQDITERRQAEKALAEQRNLLCLLIDNLPQNIFIKDMASRFVMVNQSILAEFGVATYQEVIGKSDFDFHTSEKAAVFRADELEILTSGQPRLNYEESVYDRRYGGMRWFNSNKIPLRDDQGTVIGLVGINEDITEHRQIEAHKLELELQREKVLLLNHFLTDAAHDLRTPITVMKTSLHILKRFPDPEKQAVHIGRLEEGLDHIHRLIEDLFTLVRLDMAASDFNLKPGDLNVLVEIVCDGSRELAVQHGHSLNMQLDPVLPKVQLDQMEFTPALRQLVANALNYTPDGGEITVATSVENQQVVVSVRDNGTGISAEDLPHIFDRFFRVDKARGRRTGGSGLGLTIAQKIVEAHGGQIQVESTPDTGSIFRIVLPIPAADGVSLT